MNREVDDLSVLETKYQKILVLFAHPAIQKSRVNRELMKEIQKSEGITFHDLYETYPDFYIDVKTEQNLLLENDIIVFMHPFYWYSLPSLLKEWIDLVLEHGFAYGENGTALRGKKLVSVITTAGSESSYQIAGSNRFSIQQLLAPIHQTAFLCGMQYLPPFAVHGVLTLTAEEISTQAEHLKNILHAIRDNKVDFSKLAGLPYLNAISTL